MSEQNAFRVNAFSMSGGKLTFFLAFELTTQDLPFTRFCVDFGEYWGEFELESATKYGFKFDFIKFSPKSAPPIAPILKALPPLMHPQAVIEFEQQKFACRLGLDSFSQY